MILFVGALQVRKNVSRLVKAFERVHEDWRLVLAGSIGGYGAAEVMQHIEASPARSRIQVLGHVSDLSLADLYHRASLFAFPSLDEGFGMPVLEAMARGVPVITSDRSALPEVAGNAALLVDPHSVDAIAAALLDLIEHPERRAHFEALGRERAAMFPWSRAVESTYDVYRELLC